MSLFINPQLFLSSPRKKETQGPCILVWKYLALTIVMFNFNSPTFCVVFHLTQPLNLLCGLNRVKQEGASVIYRVKSTPSVKQVCRDLCVLRLGTHQHNIRQVISTKTGSLASSGQTKLNT